MTTLRFDIPVDDPVYALVYDPAAAMRAAALMLIDPEYHEALGPVRRVIIKRAVRRYFANRESLVLSLRELARPTTEVKA